MLDAEQLRPWLQPLVLPSQASLAAVTAFRTLWHSVRAACVICTLHSMPPRRQPNQAQQQLPSRVTAVRDLNHFDQLRNGSQLCVAIYTDVSIAHSSSRVDACDPALISRHQVSRLTPLTLLQTTKPQLAIISRALAELSQQPQFRHVTFAEIDISVDDIEVRSHVPPAETGCLGTTAQNFETPHFMQEILDEQKIQEIPKLQAWKRGEVLTVRGAHQRHGPI